MLLNRYLSLKDILEGHEDIQMDIYSIYYVRLQQNNTFYSAGKLI